MLGIPSVWGPVAGGEFAPDGYAKYLGAGAKAEAGRKRWNGYCLKMPWVKKSLRAVNRILVSNRVTGGFLGEFIEGKSVVVPPNALREEDLQEPPVRGERGEVLQLLYVGNCAPTRIMPIIFEALSEGVPFEWEITVVGEGSALAFWKEEVERLGLDSKVEFTGRVPMDEVRRHYAATDLLLFPALRDSGGSALLEAMSLCVPILCFDWAGPGEMVTEETALFIPVGSPEETKMAIREGMIDWVEHPEKAIECTKLGRERALKVFQWESRRELVEKVYAEVLQEE
ncbi:glycosyltransferase [bacterium]|nr:glycosyltransferase [Akkermansiaceae bacterium]MDB4732061.1 glycosyltransferase [bacterium]